MLDISASPGKFTPCIRLLIAYPQPIVLQGLKSVFAAQHDFEIVASCSGSAHFLESVRNLAPDVALVAGTLPDLTASEILAVAKAEGLSTRLMFFAEPGANDDVAAAVAAGACHVVSTYAEPDMILRSVRLVADRAGALAKPSGDLSASQNDIDGARIEKMLSALTQRERQIVQLVSEGLSNKEIARELNVSRGTVKVHLYNIFQKLGVNNRTVLATIALLKRPTGFTTLLLALAVAILSDIDPSDASVLPDDASATPGDTERPALAFWEKPILRPAFDLDSPGVLHHKGSVAKESQVAHSSARIDGPSGAGQAAFPGSGRGHGTLGSGASALLVPSSEPASNTIRNYSGHAIVALTAAGLALDTPDLSHAAGHVLEPGETITGAAAVAIQDAAVIRDGATHIAKNAPDVAGKAAPADSALQEGLHAPLGRAGNDAIKGNGGDDAIDGGAGADVIDGNNAVADGDNGDKPAGGGQDDGLVHRSAADFKFARFDPTGNITLGPDRINLAAFGALAFLQLTSASQSIPPHTLAWIYNAVSNETIVYLNPTDRSLEIGDAGLLEIHLQGVVSAAEIESASQPDAASVAAASQGIDPTLLDAVANDGTVLTADGLDATVDTAKSDSLFLPAGAWGMQTEDGFRFLFGRDLAGTGASTMLASFDGDSSAITEPPDVSAAVVPVQMLPIEVAHSHAANPAGDNLAFKSEPLSVSTGAVTIAHGNSNATAGHDLIGVGAQGAAAAASAAPAEFVEPGAGQGNGHAHDSAQHASSPASANASEPSGNGVGHGNSQAPSHAASAQVVSDVEPADTPGRGNSNSSAAAGKSIETDGAPGSNGHGNSNASRPASANAADPGAPAELGAAPGNAVGHAKHASNPAAEQASASMEPVAPGDPPGHGNSHPPSHAAAGKSADPDGSPGSNGHGNSQASHPASANAADPGVSAEPSGAVGNAIGHAKHASNPAGEQALASIEPVASGDPPGHGNSQPPSHAAASKSAEPDAAPGGSHGNSDVSHPAFANAADPGAPAEPSAAPGNGTGNAKYASVPPVEQASAPEPTEPSAPSAHANSQPPSSPASADMIDVNGGGHGNRSQALHASANPPTPQQPAEPPSGGGKPDQAFHFNDESLPASSSAASDPTGLTDPPGPVLHSAELTAILETSPPPVEVHGASHVNNGQHHALAHGLPDLLT